MRIARLSAGPRLGRQLTGALRDMDVVHAQGLATLTLPLETLAGPAPAALEREPALVGPP